jgi:hypothetical protein
MRANKSSVNVGDFWVSGFGFITFGLSHSDRRLSSDAGNHLSSLGQTKSTPVRGARDRTERPVMMGT